MRGLSLVELIIVVGILLVIGTIVAGPWPLFQRATELTSSAEQALSLVIEARSRTLASQNASAYGVHFETTQIVLFQGPSFLAGAPGNLISPLSPDIEVSATVLNGGGADVVFKRLTGQTSQYGTVTLRSISSGRTKVLTIHEAGTATL